jgi:hypothetical protein
VETRIVALTHLGLVYWRQGRHQRATACHQQALTFFRQLGIQLGEGFALTHLGLVDCQQPP